MSEFVQKEIGNPAEIGKNFNNGKAFLHDLLGLSSCEISVNFMPKGAKIPFCHRHKQNEEVYIFLSGEGTMTIDDTTTAVKPGSCLKVNPTAKRTMEAKTDLQYVCVQAKAGSLEQFGFGDGQIC